MKLSQWVVDALHKAGVGGALAPNSSNLAGLLDGSGAPTTPQPGQTVYWFFYDNTMELNFGAGTTLKFNGLQIPDLAAQHGTAIATSIELKTSTVSLTQQGQYVLDYSLINNVLSLQGMTGHTTSGTLFNGVMPWSPDYNLLLNNLHVDFSGALDSDSAGNVSGNLSEIRLTPAYRAELPLYQSAAIQGDLSVSTDAATQQTSIGGSIRSMRIDYHSGSYEWVFSNTGELRVGSDTKGGFDLLADSASFTGDDRIKVDLPGTLYDRVLIAAGTGDDFVEVSGGGGKLDVAAGDGDDFIILNVTGDNHHVDGGSGIDHVLYLGDDIGYTVSAGPDGITVRSPDGTHVDTLVNVERLSVGAGTWAYDIDGHAGDAYRLYSAAFGREPDRAGLKYWIDALDDGASLHSVATAFIASDEFMARYGANVDDAAFLTAMYDNILDRAPDPGGYQYWMNILGTGAADRASVLGFFSEGSENKAKVIGLIEDGIFY